MDTAPTKRVLRYRVLLAHKKGVERALLDVQRVRVAEALRFRVQAARPDRTIDLAVTLGLESFEWDLPRLGGWTEWARWCGSGSRPNGEPSFDAIVVPDQTIGRATKDMIEAALSADRAVRHWTGMLGVCSVCDGPVRDSPSGTVCPARHGGAPFTETPLHLSPVVGVRQVSDSWKDGWEVLT